MNVAAVDSESISHVPSVVRCDFEDSVGSGRRTGWGDVVTWGVHGSPICLGQANDVEAGVDRRIGAS